MLWQTRNNAWIMGKDGRGKQQSRVSSLSYRLQVGIKGYWKKTLSQIEK